MFILHRGVAVFPGLAAAAFTCIAVLSLPTHADVEVMSSTVPELAVGDILADDAVFKIPEGAEVLLVRTPQGTTHELNGPFEGTIEDYEARAACSALDRFLGRCDVESDAPAGGVRGIARPPAGGAPGGVPDVEPPPVGGVRGVR